VEIDLLDAPADAFDRMGRPDAVVHLAWGGLPNYLSLHHFEEELPAQYRFLAALVRGGLKSLVVAGTCFEYGMQSGALGEETETRPANPYGFAKDVLRGQLEYLRQATPFHLTWVRLFYLFGDGQPRSSLFTQLRCAVESGARRFNMSGGEQLRDYLPVTEAAACISRLALSGRDNGVINVCSGRPISVRRLVEGWLAAHGWSIELNLGHYPYPVHEPMAFWGVREKLDRCLEPNPRIQSS
jgi:dTDP-6-deoxy-L-talose 4-dehydrogenase (NAD+)